MTNDVGIGRQETISRAFEPALKVWARGLVFFNLLTMTVTSVLLKY